MGTYPYLLGRRKRDHDVRSYPIPTYILLLGKNCSLAFHPKKIEEIFNYLEITLKNYFKN